MNNVSLLRTLSLLSALALSAGTALHAESAAARMTAQSASFDEIAVREAGPYVEVGSYRIWVSSHLGRPASVLADGTWLYRNFQVDDSQAAGTLAVTFQGGRVASLKLLSGARVAALQSHKTDGRLVASR